MVRYLVAASGWRTNVMFGPLSRFAHRLAIWTKGSGPIGWMLEE
jgi:hypothetical protein